MLYLLLQPFHTVRSCWLPSIEVAAAVKGKPLLEATKLLRTLLTRMLPGAVEVELKAEKHQEFMEPLASGP